MPRKNRMYQPTVQRSNPNHIGTIEAATLRKFEKAARRSQHLALASRSGAGAHGEANKPVKHRAERRKAKQQARNWHKES